MSKPFLPRVKNLFDKHIRKHDNELVQLLGREFNAGNIGCFFSGPDATIDPNQLHFIFIKTGSENALNATYMNALATLRPHIEQYLEGRGLKIAASSWGYSDQFHAFCLSVTIKDQMEAAERVEAEFKGRTGGIKL